jgi:hypothetical protein
VKKRRPNSEALNAAFDRLAEAAVGEDVFPAGTVFVPDDSPYSALLVTATVMSGAPVALVRGDGETQLFLATGASAVTATYGAENEFHVTESSGGFVRTVHPVIS